MPNAPMFLVWSIAYLVGSIPFGWLVARMRGVDIFKEGSGNIGATNVGRVLGKPLGLLVFVLDFAKGAAAVAASQKVYELFGGEVPTPGPTGLLQVGAALAAFLGHLFPIYLRFRGGKGVATAAGVFSVLFPLPALAALLGFVAVVTATRIVSLASLYAAVVLVAGHFLQVGHIDWFDPRTGCALVALVLVFVRHRSNIARLKEGSERQLSPHPALAPTARSLHVLSLGLWGGMGLFFTFVVALGVFRDFDAIAEQPARPVWFPLPAAFEHVDGVVNGPKEQGSRAAGFVVSGIFPTYFLLQILFGVVAFGTALGWPRWRIWIIGLAFLLAIVGWPIERKVADLRPIRNQAIDAYLQAADRAPLRPALESARAEFGGWHVVSLFLNFGVMAFVLIATALPPGEPSCVSSRVGPRDDVTP